jgi:hypothetical protein
VKRLSLLLVLTACAGPAPPSRPADATVSPALATPPDGSRRPDLRLEPDAGELVEEPADPDPRSATVKLKLVVMPAAQGTVSWGRKRLAELKPGQMSVELERPRSSGPLDLVIRAEGFLPHHVRMFSDRDDKLVVRLYRPDEAQGLLGYRRATPSYAPAPAP